MSSNKPGRLEQPSYEADPSYKKMAVLLNESTETIEASQLVEITTNVLYVNGPADPEDQIAINSYEEVPPLVIKYLASKGLEVMQDLEKHTVSIKYNATEGSTVITKEFEQFHMVQIVSEEFDNLFKEVISLAIEEAFNDDEPIHLIEPYPLVSTTRTPPNDAIRQPPRIVIDEMYTQVEPKEEPGILEKFASGCTYYFNSAYNAVFGEPEPALKPVKSIADEVTIMPYPHPAPKP